MDADRFDAWTKRLAADATPPRGDAGRPAPASRRRPGRPARPGRGAGGGRPLPAERRGVSARAPVLLGRLPGGAGAQAVPGGPLPAHLHRRAQRLRARGGRPVRPPRQRVLLLGDDARRQLLRRQQWRLRGRQLRRVRRDGAGLRAGRRHLLRRPGRLRPAVLPAGVPGVRRPVRRRPPGPGQLRGVRAGLRARPPQRVRRGELLHQRRRRGALQLLPAGRRLRPGGGGLLQRRRLRQRGVPLLTPGHARWRRRWPPAAGRRGRRRPGAGMGHGVIPRHDIRALPPIW